MKATDKKIAILIEDQFNEHELLYPYYRLQEAGAKVRVVGTGRMKTFHGKSGLAFEPDTAIDQVKAANFDGLVIPGGYAPDYMRRNTAMVTMVRDMVEQGKPVAAICHAGWMLSSADVLKGRRVTSVPAIRDDLVHAGATWVDQDVVVDGKLITSRMPEDLPVFMKAFLESL